MGQEKMSMVDPDRYVGTVAEVRAKLDRFANDDEPLYLTGGDGCDTAVLHTADFIPIVSSEPLMPGIPPHGEKEL
jgi:hypothetical protein